jgi:hypothetical protein
MLKVVLSRYLIIVKSILLIKKFTRSSDFKLRSLILWSYGFYVYNMSAIYKAGIGAYISSWSVYTPGQ